MSLPDIQDYAQDFVESTRISQLSSLGYYHENSKLAVGSL